jgi:hypothetical protein
MEHHQQRTRTYESYSWLDKETLNIPGTSVRQNILVDTRIAGKHACAETKTRRKQRLDVEFRKVRIRERFAV